MKIFVFRKKIWSVVGCLCLAACMFWAVNYPAAVGVAATTRQLPIYCVEPEEGEKKIALSFAAAWGADDTDTLIEILGKYHVRATFFLGGQGVATYPEEVRKLAEAGHEIMNHSNNHPYFTQCSTEKVIEEIESCNDKIEAITGVRPTLVRCPYGDYNDSVVNTIRSLGMEPIQWDVDSLDWKDYDAATIPQRVTEKVGPGSIVPFPNAAPHPPEALPGILAYLLGQGSSILPDRQHVTSGEAGRA